MAKTAQEFHMNLAPRNSPYPKDDWAISGARGFLDQLDELLKDLKTDPDCYQIVTNLGQLRNYITHLYPMLGSLLKFALPR